jgi:hypothetical protein
MKKIWAVLALTIVFLTPTIVKAEEVYNEYPDNGSWAILDAQGTVQNVIVCSGSVCGDGGVLGGKVPNCETCTFAFQTPADPITNNVSGYMNAEYNSVDKSWDIGSGVLQNGVVSPYPLCSSLTTENNTTKCINDSPSNTTNSNQTVNNSLTTFGKYKTMNSVAKKIKPKKKKKGKKKCVVSCATQR